MWEPKPDELVVIELAAKSDGVLIEEFIKISVLAIAEYKLRNQVQQLLKLAALLPKDMRSDVWNEIQTITLALGLQYYKGIETLPELDDKE